jgi:hypothetical protein
MSVTGERTEHSATTAAVDVTYWATEFERAYLITAAARPRGKHALIRRCRAGLGEDHKGSQFESSACSLGSRVRADSGGGGVASSESANCCEFTGRQPGHFGRDDRLLRPAPHRTNHQDVSILTGQRRAEASWLWKRPRPDHAEERPLTGKLPTSGGAVDLKPKSGFGFLQPAVPLARGDRTALVDVDVSLTYRPEVLPDEYPDVRKVVSDALAALQSKSRKGFTGRDTLTTLQQNCSKTMACFCCLQSDW